jgi:hypothetical protein
MITNIFLFLVYITVYTLTLPLRILSDVSLNSNIASTISTVGGYINGVSLIVPVSTLLQIFGVMLGIEVAILSYKGFMWLLKRIPTQS